MDSNTIKFFVSITSTGVISYMSRAFGGRTSDKVLTLRSGFLDKLQYGDQVMADRGFFNSRGISKSWSNSCDSCIYQRNDSTLREGCRANAKDCSCKDTCGESHREDQELQYS